MAKRYQSLVHYVREAAGSSSSQYLAVHNHPVLLWPQGREWSEQSLFQFETFAGEYNDHQALHVHTDSETQISKTLVIEVRKLVESSPTHMICVGRAANNDIVFSNNTVSKLHAYFLQGADGTSYELVDANSTNGTRVNRHRLIPYQSQVMVNRDQIQFGPSIQVMYLTAQGIYELLHQLHRSGIV